jgi:hypothetical protein
MPAIGTLKRITEKIAGWARPAPDDLGDLVRQRKPQTYRFKDDGVVMHFGVGRAPSRRPSTS